MAHRRIEPGSEASRSDRAAALSWFAGGGEMGALMRATDWSRTPLGPVEQWPQSLRTVVGVLLGSRFPMMVWWGPNLLNLYNDAYRPILRDKHPASLAAPAAELWAEIWDFAGPLAQGVLAGGPATWMEDVQLFIKSADIAEETYFTFSYSPVPDDYGQVGGLLNTVQETTVKVQSERQIRMLHDLAARAGEAQSELEAFRVASAVLATNEFDLPFALIYAVRGGDAVLVATSRWEAYAGAAKPDRVPLEGDAAASWPLAEALHTHREILVEDLAARFGSLPEGSGNARPERAIVWPLQRAGQSAPGAFLVAGISPHRVFDERYQRFFRATADQLASAATNAGVYEAEKRRAEALSELDRTKTAFFSNVSHEFRTPLTLLLGPLEDALADGAAPLPEPQRERLDLVQRNALRLLKLVNALLDFSRIEAGRMRATYAPTDLGRLTAELVSSFRSAADRAGLRLLSVYDALSEPAYVDGEMWEKIVLNLLSNAFKFTFSGEIAVRLRETETAFELEVRDTGTGIPPEELPYIFDRFHRVEGAKARISEGSGIGLSLVLELVRLHSGAVTVRSELEQGTTFTVSIPKGRAHLPAEALAETAHTADAARAAVFAEEAARPPALPSALSAASGPPVAPPEGASRARILIVDDTADLRTYMSRLLAPLYIVQLAEDGHAALDAIRVERPDLVLSDVMMPRLDGFGLLRALRAEPRTRTLPLILLSARAGEEAAVEGLDAGADDYLAKPFSARELLARVRTHLELARAREAWAHELERINHELEAFSYSASHDLRAPLRAIEGFSQALLEEHAETLGAEGRHYLERVRAATQRMAALIDALLRLARLQRTELRRERLDLGALASDIVGELRRRDPARPFEVEIAAPLVAHADRALLAVVLENLLGNAWKFTAHSSAPRVVVGQSSTGERPFYVRDNGAGFDTAHASKLFAPFQRLHSEQEFEGTGIGLATVQRIVARHGGRIWADSCLGAGATFFFTLGVPE
jgi:signal transduction histidine kinase